MLAVHLFGQVQLLYWGAEAVLEKVDQLAVLFVADQVQAEQTAQLLARLRDQPLSTLLAVGGNGAMTTTIHPQ